MLMRKLHHFYSRSKCWWQGLQNPKPSEPPPLIHGESMLENRERIIKQRRQMASKRINSAC